MHGPAKGLRRLEIALAVVGLSLIGGVLAATVLRWDYQARQGRAFSHSEARHASPVSAHAVSALAEDRLVRPPPEDPPEEPLDPLTLGRIEIPRLGIRAMVRRGTDKATLALAVGHLDGTSRPGESGNAVLAGHRDTFFRALRRIRLADEIRFVSEGNTYDYRVVSLEVVGPTEIRVLEPTSDEVLTLVTCYPFHYIGPAPDRFIVKASRVERPSSGPFAAGAPDSVG